MTYVFWSTGVMALASYVVSYSRTKVLLSELRER